MINNRQAGRRRGRGGNGSGNGGNGGGNNPRSNGQRDTGNRIDNRARGNANQLYEKYKNLASDAQRQGDRVNTEYYLQFADHYFRVLSETRNRFDEQNQQRRQQNDGYEAQAFVGSFDTGFDNQDDEYGDEGEPIRQGEQALVEDRDARGNGQDTVGGQNGQPNGQANGQPNGQGARREGRPQRDDARPPRDGNRNDGNRNESSRRDDDGGERYRADRETNRDPGPRQQPDRQQPDRNQQPRYEASREAATGAEEAPRRQPRMARRDESMPDAAPVIRQDAPVAEAPVADAAPEAEAPRRRGRPRRERPVEDDAPIGFDAALLPPSLGIAPAAAPVAAEVAANGDDATGAEEKPRRRRVRAAPTEAPPAS